LEGLVGGWRLNLVQVAFVGKAGQAARMVTSNFASHDPGSRFPAFWGPNFDWIPDQCQASVILNTLQYMLMQTDGKKIYLLPAWPKDWNANFKLHAPYQTIVEGRVENGKVVVSGPVDRLRNDADVQRFYLGYSEGASEVASLRDVKHYKRRKRWLS
jgi:hypothetical protein